MFSFSLHKHNFSTCALNVQRLKQQPGDHLGWNLESQASFVYRQLSYQVPMIWYVTNYTSSCLQLQREDFVMCGCMKGGWMDAASLDLSNLRNALNGKPSTASDNQFATNHNCKSWWLCVCRVHIPRNHWNLQEFSQKLIKGEWVDTLSYFSSTGLEPDKDSRLGISSLKNQMTWEQALRVTSMYVCNIVNMKPMVAGQHHFQHRFLRILCQHTKS